MTAAPETPLLDGLRAAPGGFGQPTFANFYAALIEAARRRAAAGEVPPVLLVMGEPLAGKSTVLSRLFVRLTVTPVRPYLVRWGDTIRAAKNLGELPPERQFGDLTADELARVSGLLAEATTSAQAAARGSGPALVVVEAPGVTMVTTEDGRVRGLDRAYSLARTLAQQEYGFLMVLCADPRVREANLSRRVSRLTAGGPDVREATQLAANRIRQQLSDLLYDLAADGTIHLPEPAPSSPLTRGSLDLDPTYRTEAVLRAYLPYLLDRDLKIPAERAFIALNGYIEGTAAPDMALLDAYDWTNQHFDS